RRDVRSARRCCADPASGSRFAGIVPQYLGAAAARDGIEPRRDGGPRVIDRRDALAGIVARFGATTFAPIARAASVQVAVIDTGPPSSEVFTAGQRALVSALSERVIPTTDTPGAIAAEVPQFIEKLLADWARPEDKEPILAGLDAIEA